jgi:Prophage minor tail protein Z (GPZ)
MSLPIGFNITSNVNKVVKDAQSIKGAIDKARPAATNKAGAQAVNAATREAVKTYNIKQADLKKATKLKKARVGDDEFIAGFGGDRIRLIKFSARQNRIGVSVVVMKTHGRKVISHAFIKPLKGGGPDTVYIRKGGPRLPVKSLLGPAPWQIFKGQEQLVFKVFDDKFPALLEHEIEYRLGRL